MNKNLENVEEVLGLSPLQQGLVFHDVLDETRRSYAGVFRFRVHGRIDPGALAAAWSRTVARHQALRASFHVREDGTPIQIVWREVSSLPAFHDLRGRSAAEAEAAFAAYIESERARGFVLAEAPLIRLALFQTHDETHELIVSNHHIILDGWSLHLLFGELFGPAVEGAPRQYADYLGLLARDDAGEHDRFWRSRVERVTTATPLGIPERVGPKEASGAEVEVQRRVDSGLMARLGQLTRAAGVTLNTIFTGAWALVLSRYSGERDVVLGVTTSGRTASFDGIEDTVGLFINTVPVPVACPADVPWTTWATGLQLELSAIREHETTPLVEIKKQSAVTGAGRLFDSIFVFQNYPTLPQCGEVRVEMVSSHEHIAYPLTITVEMGVAPPALTAAFDSSLYEASTIERLLGHLEALLATIADRPDEKIGALSMLAAGELAQLQTCEHPGMPYDASVFVHERIAEHARATPDAVAVEAGAERLSYRALDDRSSTLARHLAEAGVAQGVLVAICMDRSLEMFVGLLGVLKAGGAYVPLDPSYPAERLRYMLGDSRAALVLANPASRAVVEDLGVPIVTLDAGGATLVDRPPARAVGEGKSRPRDMSDPAYVIYTSGSSGKPKGVLATQGNIVHLAAAMQHHFGLGAGDRCLQFCSVSFDSSISDIFGTLANGGTLVLPPWRLPETTGDFEAFLHEARITLVDLPTTFWHYWVDRFEPTSKIFDGPLRIVMIGGEACRPSLVARWNRIVGDRIELANNYGPTETTVNATSYGPRDRDAARETQHIVIGRPFGDGSIFVLDGEKNRAPIGVRGEIYVGGPGVTAGYLHRPELTAQRFVASPWDAGALLYATGDAARYLPDGSLEYLGRTDDQVKIRGYRVEPGEVESILAAHDRVSQVAVVARDHASGKRLVAYVVPKGALAREDLRAFLQPRVPEYLVPSAFVFLDAMPLTGTGKIDRRALPPPANEEVVLDHVAPRNAVEEILAGVWAQVLGVERVGVHDNFFALGGHSLLAMQLVSRIRLALGTTLSLRTLFERPTVLQLAALQGEQRDPSVHTEIPRVPRDGPLPLSFAQQRLWFLDQLEPESPFYNIPVGLRVTGALDLDHLRKSLEALMARHEVLRSAFVYDGDQVLQKIGAVRPLGLAVRDLSEMPAADRARRVRDLARAEALTPFDLKTGPVLRCLALRLAPDAWFVVVNMHHIVADAWSCEIFFSELEAIYGALASGKEPALPAPAFQYADYASWQRQRLSGALLERDLAYWTEQLRGAPRLLDLPTDRPRPALIGYRGGVRTFAIDGDLTRALRALSRREGVTLYMTILSAFAVLLGRYSLQEDLVVGSPVANRQRVELEALIGFFVNMLALRIDLSGAPTFIELLRRVRQVTLGAYEHQELPFERLVEELQPERSQAHAPIYQVMCTLDAKGLGQIRLGDARADLEDVDIESCKFDLALHLTETDAGLDGLFSYRCDLFDAETIDRMVGHLQRLLAAAVAAPDEPIARLPMVTDGEARERARWNATETRWDGEQPVHRLIEAQARRVPHAVAVVAGDEAVTYAELDRRANQLARYLIARGAGPGALVVLGLDRSIALAVALLAVWKAGAAYVPLDPSYPRARLTYMVENSAAPVMITAGGVLSDLSTDATRLIDLDEHARAIAAEDDSPVDGGAGLEDLAYVIYTSGSTGSPKGVPIAHDALLNHMLWMQSMFAPERDEAVLHKTPISFDASVWELCFPLMTGTRLVMAAPGAHKDPVELVAAIQAHGITTLQVVPSMFRALLDTDGFLACETLRRVFCGGEALATDLVDRFLAAGTAELVNLYGPTEATIDVTWWRCTPGNPRATAPIGLPLPNTRVRLLDAEGTDVPVGVAGELYVGGRNLARGYLHQPELTAERFVSRDGDRLYRTGDLARFLPGGVLEYVGRTDHQVKLRGFRIELGEIERALLACAGVKRAVVVVHDTGAAASLVAYLVADMEAGEDALRAHVGDVLPEHMVPSVFVFLDELPLLPNGKIDRAALPAPERRADDAAYVAPRDSIEETVAAIWSDVLNVERVGVHDDFFDLGGHSMLAVQVAARIRKALGAELALAKIFERPTVAGIADEVRGDATRAWCTDAAS